MGFNANFYCRTEQLRHYKHRQKEEDKLLTRKLLSQETNVTADIGLEDKNCLRPEYIVFTWILCLIALTSALKLYYLVKSALATVIVLVYATLILTVCCDIFSDDPEINDSLVTFLKQNYQYF